MNLINFTFLIFLQATSEKMHIPFEFSLLAEHFIFVDSKHSCAWFCTFTDCGTWEQISTAH